MNPEFLKDLPEIRSAYEKRILLAKAGDVDSAMWLIKEFCSSFSRYPDGKGRGTQNGFPTPNQDELLDYLVDCFSELFDDRKRPIKSAKADEALKLRSSKVKGRPFRSSIAERNSSLGILVEEQYRIEKYASDSPVKEGSPLNRAILKISQDEGVGFDVTRKAYEAHVKKMQRWLEACDEKVKGNN